VKIKFIISLLFILIFNVCGGNISTNNLEEDDQIVVSENELNVQEEIDEFYGLQGEELELEKCMQEQNSTAFPKNELTEAELASQDAALSKCNKIFYEDSSNPIEDGVIEDWEKYDSGAEYIINALEKSNYYNFATCYEDCLQSEWTVNKNINAFCEIKNNSLDCPDPILFVPPNQETCIDTDIQSGLTDASSIQKYFPEIGVSYPLALRNTTGTPKDFRGGGQKVIMNPAVIFPDEAFTITLDNREMNWDSNKTLQIEYGNDFTQFQTSGGVPAILYDDGTHGDRIANDGFYTRACVTVTNKWLNENLYDSGKPAFNMDEQLVILNPSLEGSEDIKMVSENVLVSEGGYFMNIGYDFTQLNNPSKPIVNNPWEFCQACYSLWTLIGDEADAIVMGTRDFSANGAWMMALANHIRGTGHYMGMEQGPTRFSISDGRNYIDGREHLELLTIINNGNFAWDGFQHEFAHALLGQTGENFPGPLKEGLNSDDKMHLDPNITARNDLQGSFKVMVDEEYSDVRISSIASKLIYDGGSFKLAPLQGSNLIWSDIFLYASGVLDKSEVTDTYYKLINPSISGCSYNGYEYSCKEGSYSISGTKTVEFTIDDWIDHFGEWSYVNGELPNPYNIAFINISDRPHSEAEIIYSTKYAKSIATETSYSSDWQHDGTWGYVTKGLIKIDPNAINAIKNSSSYKLLPKSTPEESVGNIYTSDIDLYKELYYQATEKYFFSMEAYQSSLWYYGVPPKENVSTEDYKEAVEMLSNAITLIPDLPHAYYLRALAYYYLNDKKLSIQDLETMEEKIKILNNN